MIFREGIKVGELADALSNQLEVCLDCRVASLVAD